MTISPPRLSSQASLATNDTETAQPRGKFLDGSSHASVGILSLAEVAMPDRLHLSVGLRGQLVRSRVTREPVTGRTASSRRKRCRWPAPACACASPGQYSGWSAWTGISRAQPLRLDRADRQLRSGIPAAESRPACRELAHDGDRSAGGQRTALIDDRADIQSSHRWIHRRRSSDVSARARACGRRCRRGVSRHQCRICRDPRHRLSRPGPHSDGIVGDRLGDHDSAVDGTVFGVIATSSGEIDRVGRLARRSPEDPVGLAVFGEIDVDGARQHRGDLARLARPGRHWMAVLVEVVDEIFTNLDPQGRRSLAAVAV